MYFIYNPENKEKFIDYWFFNQFPSINFGVALLEDSITGERMLRFGVVTGEDMEHDLELLSQCCRRLSPSVLEDMLEGVTKKVKLDDE